MAAAVARDANRLRRMLHRSVELTVDGGGNVQAPRSPLSGAHQVGAHLGVVLFDPAVSLAVASVNGMPGIVVRRKGEVVGVLSLQVRGRLVVRAWLVANPDKLGSWSAR